MIYGYARVSTKGQARDGNSLEDQELKLREAGAVEIFVDSYTGTKIDRPEFKRLLDTVGEGDVIVATKLDRISRSASQGIKLVDDLLERGVSIHILNMGRMDNTPTGKLIRNIMLSFAEFERDMIVQRTQEGKSIAKQRPGWKEGRPKKVIDLDLFRGLRERVDNKEMNATDAAKKLGVSRAKWYQLIKEIA